MDVDAQVREHVTRNMDDGDRQQEL
jgi:hypothetical protein